MVTSVVTMKTGQIVCYKTGQIISSLQAQPPGLTRGLFLPIIVSNDFLGGKIMPYAVTSKGQVTIPKQIRDALNLTPGCSVDFAVNPVIHRWARVRAASAIVSRPHAARQI